MKAAAAGLTASLYGQSIHAVADLYTVTLPDAVHHWTSHDRDVVSASVTWSCSGPGLERGTVNSKAGLELDDLTVTLHPGTGTVGGLLTANAAIRGEFDQAPFQLQRGFFDATGSLVGVLDVFDGTVVEVQPQSTSVQLRVKSAVSQLTRPFPFRIIQAQCPYQVYDSNCGAPTGVLPSSALGATYPGETVINTIMYSEDFDNVYWSKTNCVVTANLAVAPDGNTTGDRAVRTASGQKLYQAFQQPAGTYTLSVWVRGDTATEASIGVYNGYYGMSNWSASLSGAGMVALEGVTTYQAFAHCVGLSTSSWSRLSLTYTSLGAPFNLAFSIYPDTTGTFVAPAGVMLWGAQLASGTKPGYYVHTTSSAATGTAGITFSDSRSVASGSTASTIVLNSSSSNTVPGSTLTISGESQTIVTVSGTSLTLRYPFSAVPAIGTTCTVLRGCDKTRTTCASVFNNIARYGGFPDAPRTTSVTLNTLRRPYFFPGLPTLPAGPGKPADAFLRNISAYYGPPVSVVYGTAKVPGRVIYASPTATVASLRTPPYRIDVGPVHGTTTTVTYNGICTPTVIAVCEAPVTGITGIWSGDTHLSMSQLSMVSSPDYGAIAFVSGTGTVTSSFVDVDTSGLDGAYRSGSAYAGTVTMRAPMLGIPNGKVPDLQFDVTGRCVSVTCRSASLSATDASPADVVVDLLTDPRLGYAMSASQVEVDHGPDGTTDSSFRAYCTAMNFGVSQAIVDRDQGANVLSELLSASNAQAVWSEGKLKVYPLAAEATGSIYGDYLPPAYSIVIDEDEIIWDPSEDPITVTRTPDDQVFNCFPVAFPNADAGYEQGSYEYVEPTHASVYGVRRADEVSSKWISTPLHAIRVSQFLANQSINVRNRYKFRLGPRWGQLEPLDLISLTDSHLGLSGTLCRIDSITHLEDSSLEVEALEWPQGTSVAIDLTPQSHTGWSTSGTFDNIFTPGTVQNQTALMAASNWQPASISNAQWYSVVESTGPTNTLRYSGGMWITVTQPSGRLVAVGSGCAAYSDTGGRSWVSSSIGNYGSWKQVTFGGPAGYLSICTGYAVSSSDGATWSTPVAMPTALYADLHWNQSSSLYVAMGVYTGSNYAWTSTSGTTWTSYPMPASASWQRFCILSGAAHHNGRLIACGFDLSGGGNRVAVSDNGGATWVSSSVSAGTQAVTQIAYSPALDRVLVLGASGSVAYSDDGGDTWTDATAYGPSLASADAMTWGDQLFVATGKSPTVSSVDLVALSQDGVTWKTVDPGIGGQLYGVCYVQGATGQKSGYVAVGSGSATGYSLTYAR